METGESGVNGARAQRHANRENNQGSGCVIIQLQDMAGRNARVHQVKTKSAMEMFHVRVSEDVWTSGPSYSKPD